MVNNCQTNEACESALSSLPYVQGEIRENEMESLKNDFEFVREAIGLDYKDYECGLQNEKKKQDLDANAFALRRYNECTCSKFQLSVEVKSPGDKATILADILQEVRKRAQEQESSDHVEPSVATPGEIMDYQESDDDVAMNEIQKGLMKNK